MVFGSSGVGAPEWLWGGGGVVLDVGTAKPPTSGLSVSELVLMTSF